MPGLPGSSWAGDSIARPCRPSSCGHLSVEKLRQYHLRERVLDDAAGHRSCGGHRYGGAGPVRLLFDMLDWLDSETCDKEFHRWKVPMGQRRTTLRPTEQ